MRQLFGTSAIILALLATPALARTHPQPNGYIDAAAFAPYPFAEPIHTERHQHWHYWHHRQEVRHHKPRGTASIRPSSRLHKSRPHRYGGGTVSSPRRAAISQPEPAARVVAQIPEVALGAIYAGAMALGKMLDLPQGFAIGEAMPMPAIVRRRPYRLEGTLTIEGQHFRYVSGGLGRGSIPYGDHQIDDSAGDWGQRHNALGLDGGTIHDPQLGKDREGIELHAGTSSTLGCVAFENWRALKRAILAMEEKSGTAFLHVWPGSVTITPENHAAVNVVYLPDREHEGPMRHIRFVERHIKHHHSRRYAAM